jgi:hypothetical protein
MKLVRQPRELMGKLTYEAQGETKAGCSIRAEEEYAV